jgi:hypothetical protein
MSVHIYISVLQLALTKNIFIKYKYLQELAYKINLDHDLN